MKNMEESSSDYTQRVKDRITGWGPDLVGVADIEPLKELKINPPDLLQPYTRAVSIAMQLPIAVFEAITDRPTPNYAAIYQTANRLLDDAAFKTSMALQNDGYYSIPIPASQILNWENMHAAISHKAVARMAGLGWQGKNLLLITPQYGSRVRLATILTDAPLTVDGPTKNRCGKCMSCRDACPAGAIKGVNTKDHYKSRNEALYFAKCAEKLRGEFAKLPEIGVPVCGICIKACPFGGKMKR